MTSVDPKLRFLLCSYFCVALVVGSRVTLSTSSPLIQPLITSSFSLRCALEDTASSANLIGKRSVASTTSTVSNAKFVTSIFLYKDGVDLATVSEHTPAQAVKQNASFDVSGSIPGPNGEKGYLELKWLYPEATDAGSYICKIGAIDEVGHQLNYSQTTDVDVESTSIDDVVHHIITEDKLKNAEINHLTSEVSSLKDQLAEAKHIEHGVIHCYDGGVALDDGETVRKSAPFQTPYKSVPEVFTSVKEMDTNKDVNAWLDVNTVSVTTTGFTISCQALHGAHIGHLEIAWLSYP